MTTLEQFMAALSGQESGGSYTAQNSRTGAYGRFQIMPSNWPAWAAEAGIPGAAQTPDNQEKVTRFKLQQYFDQYGNWGDVASVWYSGSPLSAYTTEQRTRKQGNGNEPSIQEYVDSVLGKTGDEQMADTGNGEPTELDKVRKILDELLANPPIPTGDATEDAYNQQAWIQSLTSVVAIRKSLESGDSEAKQRQQEFSDKIAALSASLAYDNTNIDRATADINRFLSGKAESTKRADLIAESKRELRMYGVPEGKTSFSYDDLGAGFAAEARRMGIDPSKPLINYSGQVFLNPEGDMARADASMGVTGTIPSIPQLATQASAAQIQPPERWTPSKNPLAAGIGGGAMPGRFDAEAADSSTGNAVPAAWDARAPEPEFRPDWSTFLTPETAPVSEDPRIQNWRLAQGRGRI